MNPTFAAIFDMDGVIVDSNPFHKISLDIFCAKYGFSFTEEQLREKLYGRRNQEWIPAIFGEHLSSAEIAKYSEEKEALFREVYAHDIEPLAGLEHFLQLLQTHDIPRAIATSAPFANVEFTLEKTFLGHYFPTILDESYVTKGKPDPEIYLKTAAALGFSPEKCIVFEDSLAGVASGKAAGAKVVGITTTHTPEELHQADLTYPDFTHILLEDLVKLF